MPSLFKRFIRLQDVLELTLFSKSKLYEDISTGSFPAPIKQGRSSYWIVDEIVRWQEERISERNIELERRLQRKSGAD